jgi:glycosyltransferase involved in cell wall biosynthesis
MPPSVTVVIDPYGEYRRPRSAGIPFESTLEALLAQDYAAELTTILLTCTADEVPLVGQLVADRPRIRVVGVPKGSGYYQKKNFGMREATSDIVMLADGDCLYPPDWITEMVAAFDRGGEQVVYVQGTSRFAPGPYAHVLSPVYWRAFEPEGPISQVYSAHNMAIRRRDIAAFQFEDTPLRAGLERTLSERIRRAGRVIWHTRRAVVQHEGSASLKELRTQALGRGYYRMILWRRHPNRLDRALRPLGYLAIPIYVALVAGRDAGRQFRGRRERGLTGLAVLKVPAYIAVTVGFHVMGGVSMVRVLRHLNRTGEFPPPEFYGGDGPPDLGSRGASAGVQSGRLA